MKKIVLSLILFFLFAGTYALQTPTEHPLKNAQIPPLTLEQQI